MKKIFLTGFIVLIMTYAAFAETVILKTGQKVEGKITEKTDKYIKVDLEGVNLTYFLDEVASIDGQKVEAADKQPQDKNPADAKTIFEKVREANKNVLRRRVVATQEMDIKNLLHSKVETVFELDPENKIAYMSTEMKEYDFNFQDLLKSALENQIAKAKEKGIPLEKVQQAQQLTEGLSSGLKKKFDEFKGKKYESFLADNMRYTHLKDKWVKIESPSAAAFWQSMADAQKGNLDTEGVDRISNVCPLYDTKTAGALNSLEIEKLVQDVNSVSEGDFSGTPCYILDINTKPAVDMIKQKLQEAANQKGGKNVQISLDSFNIKEFVSKDKYLLLGLTANAEASFSGPAKPESSMKQSLKSEMVYSYPASKIQLPPEASQAVAVKDEAELKKMVMEDMGLGEWKSTSSK
jgi:hypothetical protein